MRISPYILLSLTSLFWSFNFILGKVLAGVVPPVAISFLRWFFPLIFFMVRYGKELKGLKGEFKAHWPLVMILGITGYCLNSVSVYEAVIYTSTINTAFINAFNPVMIALCGFVMYRYPVTGRQSLGFILSLFGVLCIMFKGDLKRIAGLDINAGDLFMIGSIVCWSIHTILYKKKASPFPAKAMFTVMMLGGVIATIPLLVIETAVNKGEWIANVRWIHVLCIVCLNIFPSVLAYQFWHSALKKVSANQVAIFQYLIPVFTTIISVLFLNENFRIFHVVGGTLIFTGVILVNRGPKA